MSTSWSSCRLLPRTLVVCFVASAFSACSADAPRAAPVVLGISMGTRVQELRGTAIEDTASAKSYPIIPFYGYKIHHPNPENWTVFVADSAPGEIEEPRIYAIALTRDLSADCSERDRREVAEQIRSANKDGFEVHTVIEDAQREEAAALLVSERRLLSAAARCYLKSIIVVIAYADLDLYRYSDSLATQKVISDSRRIATEYSTRTLSP